MPRQDSVLVYHYRANGFPVVEDGLAVIAKDELNDIMERNPELQATTKEFNRTQKSFNIRQRDLLTPRQRPAFKAKGSVFYYQNVAAVTLPGRYWLRFSELTIISDKRDVEER